MSKKNMVKMGGVAIATLGLSTCIDNGAVDPAPEPFECSGNSASKDLSATAEVNAEGRIVVRLFHSGEASATWKSAPKIEDVTSATVASAAFEAEDQSIYRVVLEPAQGATTGTFHVVGTFTGDDVDCPVDRVLTFTIDSSGVTVARRDDLPLGTRARAAISIERHEGQEVHLAATGAFAGATLGWTATAGAVETGADGRARWRLPEAPGLYQIELLVDRGREGLHIDTLTLEVT